MNQQTRLRPRFETAPGAAGAPAAPIGPAVAEPLVAAETEQDTHQVLEPQYFVLIHNDDVTPFEYVLTILARVFLLSEEIAEHVAMTAHNEGRAVVVVRPRDEAKRLIAVAHSRARMDGYPLAFTMEPES